MICQFYVYGTLKRSYLSYIAIIHKGIFICQEVKQRVKAPGPLEVVWPNENLITFCFCPHILPTREEIMGLAKDNENFEEDLQGLSEELNKEKSEKLKVEKVLADAAHALKLVLTVCTCIVIF